MDLEPKLLRAFLAIAAADSITAAAKTVGVSQPTMSGHLRRLRTHFGDPLYEFRGGRLRHTEKARELRPGIAEVVAGLDLLAARATRWSPLSAERPLRLRASAYVQELLAARLDCWLRTKAPGLRLEMSSPAIRDEAGYDATIAPRETLPPGLKMRALFSDHLVCLLDQALISADGAVSLEAFCRLPHLLLAPAPSPPHTAVDAALAAVGRARRVIRVLPSDAGLAPMLVGEERVAILPWRLAVRHAAPLRVAPIPLILEPISFVLAWPATRHQDPAGIWFRQQIVHVAREAFSAKS